MGGYFQGVPAPPSEPTKTTPPLGGLHGSANALVGAFAAGAGGGLIGGMIGLGGAEFRLPLLIGVFGFAALQAVILNKTMSLIVVITALPARFLAIPYDTVAPYWYVAVNLLAGSLVGAWVGATWVTRMRSVTLDRVLALLLILIAAALVWTHFHQVDPLALLIPTIVLLFAVDIKVAGSLSLAVSLPIMLVAFTRYGRDNSFTVLTTNKDPVLTQTLKTALTSAEKQPPSGRHGCPRPS